VTAPAERALKRILVALDASRASLDALAAAYAEVGRLTDAIKTAQRAMAAASAAGRNELAGQIEAHLKKYQSGQPWREP